MSSLVQGVGAMFGIGGQSASSLAKDAQRAQAGATAGMLEAQREALNYLKEREAIPQQFREEALTRLGGLYGLEGGKGTQQKLIDYSKASPIFKAIMGAVDTGEEAIMRQASATGGLRSGNVQHALYDYNTQLQNKALLEAYNQQLQGLQSLSQLPSNASQIASGITNIGQTQAQGLLAQQQAYQQGAQQSNQNILGLAQLGLGLFG